MSSGAVTAVTCPSAGARRCWVQLPGDGTARTVEDESDSTPMTPKLTLHLSAAGAGACAAAIAVAADDAGRKR